MTYRNNSCLSVIIGHSSVMEVSCFGPWKVLLKSQLECPFKISILIIIQIWKKKMGCVSKLISLKLIPWRNLYLIMMLKIPHSLRKWSSKSPSMLTYVLKICNFIPQHPHNVHYLAAQTHQGETILFFSSDIQRQNG